VHSDAQRQNWCKEVNKGAYGCILVCRDGYVYI